MVRQPRPTTRAFTLVELLVVLVVLVVISAVAVPRFALANQRFGLEMASQQVSRDLAFAQDHARAQSTAFVLEISADNDTISLLGPTSAAKPPTVHTTYYGDNPFGVDLVALPGFTLNTRISVSGHGDLDSNLVMRLTRSGMKVDIIAMEPGGLVNISSITRYTP